MQILNSLIVLCGSPTIIRAHLPIAENRFSCFVSPVRDIGIGTLRDVRGFEAVLLTVDAMRLLSKVFCNRDPRLGFDVCFFAAAPIRISQGGRRRTAARVCYTPAPSPPLLGRIQDLRARYHGFMTEVCLDGPGDGHPSNMRFYLC